jgi:hypothetical protein
VGKSEGQEEQKILCPVVAAQGVDPRAKRRAERWARFEDRSFERSYGCGLLGTGLGADHVSCPGVAPNLYVGGGVAHILEASFGEMLRQKRSFVCSLEIQLAVAGVDFVEEAEIAGNGFGKLAVGGRCERNAAAAGSFLLEKIKDLLPIVKTSGVESDPRSKLAFEGGSSRKQPEREQ